MQGQPYLFVAPSAPSALLTSSVGLSVTMDQSEGGAGHQEAGPSSRRDSSEAMESSSSEAGVKSILKRRIPQDGDAEYACADIV